MNDTERVTLFTNKWRRHCQRLKLQLNDCWTVDVCTCMCACISTRYMCAFMCCISYTRSVNALGMRYLYAAVTCGRMYASHQLFDSLFVIFTKRIDVLNFEKSPFTTYIFHTYLLLLILNRKYDFWLNS